MVFPAAPPAQARFRKSGSRSGKRFVNQINDVAHADAAV